MDREERRRRQKGTQTETEKAALICLFCGPSDLQDQPLNEKGLVFSGSNWSLQKKPQLDIQTHMTVRHKWGVKADTRLFQSRLPHCRHPHTVLCPVVDLCFYPSLNLWAPRAKPPGHQEFTSLAWDTMECPWSFSSHLLCFCPSTCH